MTSALNNSLWIAQTGLAFAFVIHGRAMISPPESMRDRTGYLFAISPRLRTFIGVAELLAAAGLILPSLTGILPWLTPLAAFGLVIVMAGAMVIHVQRSELPNIVFNLVLLLVSAFVAHGRWSGLH